MSKIQRAMGGRWILVIFGALSAFFFAGCATTVQFKPDDGLIKTSRRVTNRSDTSGVPESTTFVDVMAGYFPNRPKTLASSDPSYLHVTCHDADGSVIHRGIQAITDFVKDFFTQPDSIDTCRSYYVTIEDITSSFNAQVQEATPANSQYFDETKFGLREQVRNQYAQFMFSMEEYNCQSYLHSAFTNKTVMDTQRGFVQSLGTGAAAGTALATPYFSAGIGITNLVYGAALDSEDSHIYLKETIQAILAAIKSARLVTKTDINKSLTQTYSQYSLMSLLVDMKTYEADCSLRVGVAALEKLAGDAATVTATPKSVQQTDNEKSNQTISAVTPSIQESNKSISDLVKKLQNDDPSDEQFQKDLAALERAQKSLGEGVTKIVDATKPVVGTPAAVIVDTTVGKLSSSAATTAISAPAATEPGIPAPVVPPGSDASSAGNPDSSGPVKPADAAPGPKQ